MQSGVDCSRRRFHFVRPIDHRERFSGEAIEAASEELTGLVGVDPVAIRRARFSALLAVGHRTAFADALETRWNGCSGQARRRGSYRRS